MEWLPLIFLFLFFVFVLGLCGLFFEFNQAARDRAVERELKRTRLQPDKQGNYPVLFNQQTGMVVQPSPGNRANPEPVYFLMQPGAEPKKVATQRPQQPLIVNQWTPAQATIEPARAPERPKEIEGPDQPEQLPEPRRFEQTAADVGTLSDVQGERGEKFEQCSDVQALFKAAKREGRGKIETIEELTGTKRGGSKAFKDYSRLWESL